MAWAVHSQWSVRIPFADRVLSQQAEKDVSVVISDHSVALQ